MNKTLIIVASLFSAVLNAQLYQCDPNTCIVKKAGKYNIELVSCTQELELYVLDQENNPLINPIITGHVDFLYLDDTVISREILQYSRSNLLQIKIPSQDYYKCRLRLVINGRRVTATFENECDLRASNDKVK